MARGLFHLCTRKRTLSKLQALLFNHSQFHTFRNPVSPVSTRFRNPLLRPRFSQSSRLSGERFRPTRPFSATGEEGAAVEMPEGEFDTDSGEGIDFELGNEVIYSVHGFSEHGVVANDGSNECNVEIVDSIECSTTSSGGGSSGDGSNNNNELGKKSEEFVHVASRDSVKLYREIRSVEGVQGWIDQRWRFCRKCAIGLPNQVGHPIRPLPFTLVCHFSPLQLTSSRTF
ncbi:ATP-dependent RNA helicase SUPV3L1 [Spatholobus suberectus]|nr:ATP-dependent RNA helicase SUPV3L1 [Spatholobus suberectus]